MFDSNKIFNRKINNFVMKFEKMNEQENYKMETLINIVKENFIRAWVQT
mgnify:CR=1 FL=1